MDEGAGNEEDQPEEGAAVKEEEEEVPPKTKKKRKSGRSGWEKFNAEVKKKRREQRVQKKRDVQLAKLLAKGRSVPPPPRRLRQKTTVAKGRWIQSGVLRLVRTVRHVMTQTDDEHHTWVYRRSGRFNNLPEFRLESSHGIFEDGEEEDIEGDPELGADSMSNDDEDDDDDDMNAGGSIVAVDPS